MNQESILMPIRGSIPVREHSVVIGIYDKAYPVSKIQIFPFVYIEKPKEPVPVCEYSSWSLEWMRSASAEEIGAVVKKMIADIDVEKIKIENHGK